MRVLARGDLGRLFDAIHAAGRRVIGPTLRDRAIVLDEITGPEDLPRGWTDAQGPGRYRLERAGDATFEGYVVGPTSLKSHFFPARETLYVAERRADGKLGFAPRAAEAEPLAVLGARSCDLAAADVQRRVFEGGPSAEPRHRARREAAIVVAVNCTRPGELCFCTSMDTGPRVRGGADLVLTERGDELLVEAGSEAGRALLDQLPARDAEHGDAEWLDCAMDEAARSMGRHVEREALPERLFAALDHPRWADVAERCIACGNCTSVCPTCFCSTSEEPSSVDGASASHARLWDSCFTEEHAYLHGGTLRPETEQRYRQWLTHKVGSWVSQFGASGCVGCGRCIAWCPVGIDLTEEIAALRGGPDEARVPMPAAPEHPQVSDEDLVPRPLDVIAVQRESHDVVTLRVAGHPGFAPGQFSQLSLPGIGEAPISISGRDEGAAEFTIRAVGATTRALTALEAGAQLGVRGPYGQPWPLDALAGRPVVVIAGGIGLAPLREALRHMLARPSDFPRVVLLYGTRSPEDALFTDELRRWSALPAFALRHTVDHASPGWRGDVGVVPRLLDRSTVPEGAAALMCGPEIMMRYTIERLSALGVADESIWITMERHMQCATGFCGRCQYGPYFVCKDGPVFSFDRVRFLFGKSGF